MDNLKKDMEQAEESRVEAELGRVEAEAGRVHAEENTGTGRVEHEVLRVEAELGRLTEYEKFLDDPAQYVTPGAKTYFRRVTVGYVILAIAVVVGLFINSQESKNRDKEINKSRAMITYTSCLDSNNRHDNTIRQLNILTNERKESLRRGIIEAETDAEAARYRAQIDAIDDSKASTVSLIDGLAPFQNCEQLSIDRYGFVPDIK